MSQISSNEGPMLQQIDLTKLNLQQLTQLKQQLDQELGVFQDSLQTLKIAQNKFQESGISLEKITPSAKGKITNRFSFLGYKPMGELKNIMR